MTELLKKYLELAFDPYNGRRRELVDTLPREMSIRQDGETKVVKREMLLTEAIEGTGLLQTEVANTVIEGARPARCWMDILTPYRIKGNSWIKSVGEAGAYAGTVPEAAEIPKRTQDYTPVTFAIKKWGTQPGVSNEMIEDGMIDAVNEEIKFAGESVQLGFEQYCNNTMLEGSGDEWDTTGSNQGMKAVIKALAKARGSSFRPSHVVLHPDAEATCLLDLAPTGNAGAEGVAANGLIPPGYLGVNWRTCNVSDVAGGTYTWEYNSDGDIGMIVLDASRAGGIAIARPLSVEKFNDTIHDLQGMTVTMRADCKVFLSTAAVRVEY